MQSNKLIYILLAILIVMVGWVFARDKFKPKDQTQAVYLNQLKGMTPAAVKQIELAKAGQKLTLSKDNNGWQLDGYKADSETIDQLLKNLIKTEEVELRAETKAQQTSLGVDQNQGTELKLESGDKQAAMIIGNQDNGGYFVKFADSDQIFWVKGLPSQISSSNIDDWLNHNISQIPETSIKNISITNAGGKLLKLKRVGSDWLEADKPQVLDPNPLNPLITALAALKAQSLITDATPAGKLAETLTVETETSTQTLKIYQNGKDQYAIEAGDRRGRFGLDPQTAASLNLNPTALKAKPTPTPSVNPS